MDAKFNSSSKEYPCCILSMDLATWKNEKYMKIVIAITFFSCSRVHRKYAIWVLLGWGTEFCIQRVLLHEIWVKPYGDKLKIWIEKEFLLFYYFLVFLLFYTKNGESSPMVDIIILNPIGSYKVYFGCTFFLGGPIKPQNYPNEHQVV